MILLIRGMILALAGICAYIVYALLGIAKARSAIRQVNEKRETMGIYWYCYSHARWLLKAPTGLLYCPVGHTDCGKIYSNWQRV